MFSVPNFPHPSISPRLTASCTASARFDAPSLKNARFRNIFTLFSERPIAFAIAALFAPVAAIASASASRPDRPFEP